MHGARRASLVAILFGIATSTTASAQTDPLPSWNEGDAKRAILSFVHETTTPGGPKFVSPESRIATFAQDGTLWVEQPIYAQVMYALDRVPDVVAAKPELKDVERFRAVVSGAHAAIARLSTPALDKILAAAFSGMSVDQFAAEVKKWMGTGKHPRFKRPY